MTEPYERGLEGAIGLSAEDQSALRQRALNVIGHELRTPVTTLRGLAETLSFASEEQIHSEIAPAMQRVARRAEALLDDLLIAGGITTSLPTAPPCTVVPAALAASVWSQVGDGSPLPIEGAVTASVRTVEPVLERALAKVLDNAWKYGKERTVEVEHLDGGGLELRVVTKGIPVHPEELRLGRELFYRGEQAVTSAPGLGIGLAVATALLEHVGGTLEFGQASDGGIITAIRLPSLIPAPSAPGRSGTHP